MKSGRGFDNCGGRGFVMKKAAFVVAGNVRRTGMRNVESVKAWEWWVRVIEVDVRGIFGHGRVRKGGCGLVDGGSGRFGTILAIWTN